MTVENPNTPTLWEALQHVINETVASWFTSLPARVTAYDATKQSCSVQPLIKSIRRGETGAREAEPLAIINGVPVVFPGGGGYSLTFPIAVGDTVLLVMSTWSLDRWKAKGGVVDPEDERRHDISDAVAFAQIRDFAHPLTGVPTDGMSIGRDGGPRIKITTSQIQAGGTDALALHAKLTILWNHVNSLFTGGAGSAVVPIVGSLGSGTAVLKGG